jgi:hypothetical protein
VGNRLFVFGGGNGIRYLNDLHLLDAGTNDRPHTLRVVYGGACACASHSTHFEQTETMTWSQAYVAGTSPAARSRHTATLGTSLPGTTARRTSLAPARTHSLFFAYSLFIY